MTEAPGDLGAPMKCLRCEDAWFAPLMLVALAAAGAPTLSCPACGQRHGILELGEVVFFSEAEWDAWAGEGDAGRPHEYRVGSAVVIPRAAG